MKTAGDGSRSFHQVAVSENNEHVCGIGGASAFVDESKRIADIVVALGICTLPTALFEEQDKLVIIL